MSRSRCTCSLLILTAVYSAMWMAALGDWKWFHLLESFNPVADRLDDAGLSAMDVYYWVFFAALPLATVWLAWAFLPQRQSWPVVSGVASVVYVFWWQFFVFHAGAQETDAWMTARGYAARIGTAGLFFIGLMWVVWYVERVAQRYQLHRRAQRLAAGGDADSFWAPTAEPRINNPLDPDAWYYGRRQKRLNQSVVAFVSYSLCFMLAFLVMTQIGGCVEDFDLPPGGGVQQPVAQQIKIKKVKRIKYVLNPLSLIKMQVQPIEKIQLDIPEVTKHYHSVGFGKGTGGGFGGKKGGKIRFIRIEYDGGDWNHGMGIGEDYNLLIEYRSLSRSNPNNIAKKTESMRISRLRRFNPLKSPPLLYITGQRGLAISKPEEKLLRNYLLERHGMIFASAGSYRFHQAFLSLMNRVLPTVRAVPVPLDDLIHKEPYPIPFFPYVAAHGGKQAMGWKVDGRWVVYYHPGDIGDAWTNEHAGVKREIWESCYRLGANVINYAYLKHSIWREAQKKR